MVSTEKLHVVSAAYGSMAPALQKMDAGCSPSSQDAIACSSGSV